MRQFFQGSKMFGTNFLNMKPQTIYRLSSSLKYNYTIAKHTQSMCEMNNMALSLIDNNNNTLSIRQDNILDEKFSEEKLQELEILIESLIGNEWCPLNKTIPHELSN